MNTDAEYELTDAQKEWRKKLDKFSDKLSDLVNEALDDGLDIPAICDDLETEVYILRKIDNEDYLRRRDNERSKSEDLKDPPWTNY